MGGTQDYEQIGLTGLGDGLPGPHIRVAASMKIDVRRDHRANGPRLRALPVRACAWPTLARVLSVQESVEGKQIARVASSQANGSSHGIKAPRRESGQVLSAVQK